MGVSLFEMLTGKKVFGDPNDLPGDMRAKLMALRQNVERTPVHPRGAGVRPGGCQAIGSQIKACIWEGGCSGTSQKCLVPRVAKPSERLQKRGS